MVLGSLRITGPAFRLGGQQKGLGVRRADAQIIVQQPAGFLEAQVGEQVLGGAELMTRPPAQAKQTAADSREDQHSKCEKPTAASWRYIAWGIHRQEGAPQPCPGSLAFLVDHGAIESS